METNRALNVIEVDGKQLLLAPSCHRCLALLDTLFPVPKLDDRLPLIVRIIADTVLEHGTAEILDVPGGHQAALRPGKFAGGGQEADGLWIEDYVAYAKLSLKK